MIMWFAENLGVSNVKRCKEQYHLFEKQIPDIHYDIFTFNTIEKSENFNI
jgi:hypothetical protein